MKTWRCPHCPADAPAPLARMTTHRSPARPARRPQAQRLQVRTPPRPQHPQKRRRKAARPRHRLTVRPPQARRPQRRKRLRQLLPHRRLRPSRRKPPLETISPPARSRRLSCRVDVPAPLVLRTDPAAPSHEHRLVGRGRLGNPFRLCCERQIPDAGWARPTANFFSGFLPVSSTARKGVLYGDITVTEHLLLHQKRAARRPRASLRACFTT